ncbi:MAG TPA: PQQ-binding-like beta-propeller repeat protein [Gaiellaceae bacterium]|nr:PQQ-binding-like beta-propeller repeat protein [Gaiellaceae bacterium]
MSRRILVIALVAVVAVVGAGAGYYWWETRPHEVRGSSTEEFDASANPADTRQVPGTETETETEPTATAPATTPKPPRDGPLPLLDGVEWWPTYGYDEARTHVAPGYALRPPFRQLWQFRAGHYLEFPPAVAYGRVYVANQVGRFFAVNAKTGRMIWQKRFRRCIAASPVVADGIVYQAVMHPLPCGTSNRSARGFVIAMNARNGKVLWRFDAGAVESTPLVRGKTIYFGSWDRRLYAVDIRTGKLRWSYRADHEVNTSPAYAGGTLFFGTDGGRVHAVWAKTGRNRWTTSAFSRFGRREHFYATPTVAYGRVYIGNTDGTVYAFGAGTGRLLWAQRAGTYVYTAAAVWQKTVYVGSYDGNVYAFDAATGDERWRRELPAAIHGAPTILAGRIYFSTCGTCGQRGSRFAKRGPSLTFALDARTGRVVWRFGDGHYSPVVADATRVYLAGSTSVYALVERKRAR